MTEPTPLRLWLEPGYDGHFGVWLLDLPGAFSAAETREQAVSQAPSAAGWYRDWTGRHGEPLDVVIGPTEIVEEVPVRVEQGRVRFARFEADAAPVATEDLETVLRRLDYARDDLLPILDRIDALPASGQPARRDAGERSWDGVVTHVADTEIWLGSRLDPAARFPREELQRDPRTVLAATRAWTVEQVRAQHGRDPSLARDDSRGEGWTLRKVLRRLLYHSIEHLRELDRRLAVAERRTERLAYRHDRLTAIEPLV